MNEYQEPKYIIKKGKIHNRQSGEQIPDDEPIFIIRARDIKAAVTLYYYRSLVCDATHYNAVSIRAQQFDNWAKAHPDRMKEPDTQHTEGWLKDGTPPIK